MRLHLSLSPFKQPNPILPYAQFLVNEFATPSVVH